MVDLPPQNPGLSQSRQSSVAQANQQRMEMAHCPFIDHRHAFNGHFCPFCLGAENPQG